MGKYLYLTCTPHSNRMLPLTKVQILLECTNVNRVLTISCDTYDNASTLDCWLNLFDKIWTRWWTYRRCLFYSSRTWCPRPNLRIYEMTFILLKMYKIQSIILCLMWGWNNGKTLEKCKTPYWSIRNFILNTIAQ